jgi:uncharacterized protein (TIGR02594 family)
VRITKLKAVFLAVCSLAVSHPAPSRAQDLVGQARQYIGTNPTGRSHLWCGAFVDMILRQTGHRGGGNSSLAYVRYGQRVPSPVVGAIAVMGRRGGGHVGFVSGIDGEGNPIIISGNTWGGHSRRPRVLEAAYSRKRVFAYVLPD